MKNHYIIDFDSTFIRIETLEYLAEIALENNPEKEKILKQIREITNLGMEGKIPFQESLQQRLKLLKAHSSHVKITAEALKRKITKSFEKNKSFFKKHANDIYIISGSFKECMLSVLKKFKIPESHILGNSFLYDSNGYIIGVDFSNPLSYKFGKSVVVAGLRLTGIIYVVGDGFTDFEIKHLGVADYFIAFTENVHRSNVVKQGDYIVKTFDEFIKIVNQK